VHGRAIKEDIYAIRTDISERSSEDRVRQRYREGLSVGWRYRTSSVQMRLTASALESSLSSGNVKNVHCELALGVVHLTIAAALEAVADHLRER
jgi:hypothetical protein